VAGRAISTTDHVAEAAGGQAHLVGAAGVGRRNDDRRRAAILEWRANIVPDLVAGPFFFRINATNAARGANIVPSIADGANDHIYEGTSEIRHVQSFEWDGLLPTAIDV